MYHNSKDAYANIDKHDVGEPLDIGGRAATFVIVGGCKVLRFLAWQAPTTIVRKTVEGVAYVCGKRNRSPHTVYNRSR